MVVRNNCCGLLTTTEDLITALEPILQNFLLDEEADGEVVVYTGLREISGGQLIQIEDSA